MFERLETLIDNITMPNNWELFFDGDENEEYYLQVKCKGICNSTGKQFNWSGRKWRLSKHMTDGEIVQTALLACLSASEHEIREQFKYKGESIFDPHYDIEQLVELRKSPNSIKERVNGIGSAYQNGNIAIWGNRFTF